MVINLTILFKLISISLFRKILVYVITKFQYALLSYYKDSKTTELIKTIKNEVELKMEPFEAYMIYSLANARSNFKGDMAEVGVFQGGSAKIICEAKKSSKLHLFDSFEGLPEVSEIDKTRIESIKFHEKQFSNTELSKVKNYLSDYSNVFFYQGFFPKTAKPVENNIFSFVHLDVDLYDSTIRCLEFFYPRLEKGGIIVSHDYSSVIGVKKAFNDYFKDKDVSIINLLESQCMIIKL
jgi:O-methyltransferase